MRSTWANVSGQDNRGRYKRISTRRMAGMLMLTVAPLAPPTTRAATASAVQPSAQADQAAPSEAPTPQRVSFQTRDGVTIVGDYCPADPPAGQKAPLVILLHM